jgi:ribose/xylose/arabinose/galactoside ABC-type transport system permease subunit
MGAGRLLVTAGLILVAVGLLFMLGDKLPVRLGRLPGDFTIHGKNSTFYFPLATCLLLSLLFSLVLWLFRK